MKKLIFYCSFFVVILLTNNLYAQWSQIKRLTSGYKDTNPSFNSLRDYGGYWWEFMVFERRINLSSSICVIGIDRNGPLDSAKYLTANSFINRNPCIAYGFTDTIKNALVLWETNQNGRWDIYGSYYNSGIWGAPFPVDSTSGNKFNPKAIQINASEFGITYSKEGEIIYRKYNAATKIIISETNLTTTVDGRSDSPVIGQLRYNTGVVLNFRSQKPDSTFLIYSVRTTNYGDTWTLKDSITSNGNNSPLIFVLNYSDVQQVFESDRTGKNGIYSFVTGVNTIDVIHSSPYFSYSGFKAWMYPFVFESFISRVSAVVRKSNDSTKILLDAANPYHKDSVTIGDASKNTVIALNNGVISGLDLLFYAVFNKDSAEFSSLYYKTKIFVTGGITQTGNNVSDKFILYQNYPNPFNPTTKIKFDIPKSSDIKITIFDAVGREVNNITQNNLNAGSYEYEFNGENLSSGIYYFKLQTKEFVKTVKMVMMK